MCFKVFIYLKGKVDDPDIFYFVDSLNYDKTLNKLTVFDEYYTSEYNFEDILSISVYKYGEV